MHRYKRERKIEAIKEAQKFLQGLFDSYSRLVIKVEDNTNTASDLILGLVEYTGNEMLLGVRDNLVILLKTIEESQNDKTDS